MCWEIKQYYLAAELAYPSCRNCEPPGMWTGNLRVRHLLTQLWQDYQSLPVKRFQSFLDPNQQVLDSLLWDNLLKLGRRILATAEYYTILKSLHRYKTRLPILNIHLIDYPVSVECLVPPVSVLLSVTTQELHSCGYWKRVLKAVKGLTDFA